MPKPKRIHLSNSPGKTACGTSSKDPLLSSDPESVTCKHCLSAIAPLGPYSGEFYSKVAGVTFNNPDGSSRQAIINRCNVGERLILKAEPDNPYDSNAVGVLRENGEQLGYLGARQAADLQRYLLEGQTIPCCISDLTGTGEYSRGVNVYIGAWESPEQKSRSGTPYTCRKRETQPKPEWGLLFLFVLVLVVIGIVITKLNK